MRKRHGRSKCLTALLCLLFSLITIYEGVHFEDWNHRAAARLVLPTAAPVTLRPAAEETGAAFAGALQAPQTTPAPDATARPVYTQPQTAAWVIGESADVYAGASADDALIEKLDYGSELSVMDAPAQNGWYKVRTASGRTGYVSEKLISTAKPSMPPSSNGAVPDSSLTGSQPSAQTVYVSRSGECYHSRANCSEMRTPTAMTEDEAIARGRRKCSKCW